MISMIYCSILHLCYYVEMIQLSSLLSCLHSLYWTYISHPTFAAFFRKCLIFVIQDELEISTEVVCAIVEGTSYCQGLGISKWHLFSSCDICTLLCRRKLLPSFPQIRFATYLYHSNQQVVYYYGNVCITEEHYIIFQIYLSKMISLTLCLD